MKNYIKIPCECGRIVKVPLEDNISQFIGRPQNLGAVNCPVCNRRVIAYLLIEYIKEPAGTHEGIVYVD
ncbi:hypothetical protein KAU33_02340 [Candidatus Dependentiae bacterium]|nr:hypothetical protein [Candidatus Dependentiae bacterium]